MLSSGSAPALLFAILLFGAAGPLRAQDGDGDEAAAKGKGGDTGEMTEAGIIEAKAEQVKLEAAAGPHVASGLERYIQIVPSVEPARIPPGGSGTLKLALGLRPGAVLPSAADLQIEFAPEQGPALLGNWTIGEPSIATLSPAFKGRLAYETHAIITFPLAVKPGAEFGKFAINMQIVAAIAEPESGRPLGMFRGSARSELVVGPAVPRPMPIASGTRPLAAGGVPEGPDPAAPTLVDDGSTARSPGVVTTPAAMPGGAAAGQAESGGEYSALTEPDGPPWLMIGVGVLGLGLLGVILAAARSRR